jgi:nitrate reductase NapD
MNISSLVVRARPERCPHVRAALEAMPGLEVRAATEAGQLVVVAEHPDAATAADSYVAMHQIEGVLSVSLVYQRNEDPGTPQES